ncbi:hypothetical protein EMPS_08509 [Entomortierella parvispora]|uniref:Uncharacterized protein n=1 Tax=Entomortierella parvispora TaxID=205924 RepID=A0A9P3LZP1_9FUNG|nr:hypothetical protein EMPS_08509 [Entomortierella parvispora]
MTWMTQSIQSLSPTSPRQLTATISPRSPTHSRPYLSPLQRSPISPLSSHLAPLDLEEPTSTLSKHHLEWCLACCRTALDREELAPVPSGAVNVHETLQSLVDIYSDAEQASAFSPSSSFVSSTPSPSSPTYTPSPHSPLRLPIHKSSLSHLRHTSSNSSLVSRCSQSGSMASPDPQTVHSPHDLLCTCYRPSSSGTSSLSSFAASAQAAVTLALSLLRALTKEQLLDLIFLVHSKAPRDLVTAAPYWIRANRLHIDSDDDYEDADDVGEGDDYYSDNVNSDNESSALEKDAAAWSPKSLTCCPSLSLPPWRQQALENDQQAVHSINSSDPLSIKEEGSPAPPRRRPEAAMLSAFMSIPVSSVGVPTVSSGPMTPDDEPVPRIPTSEPSSVERPRRAKNNHHQHGKNHDAQECCEPGSPPCYDYRSSYWQYQIRRRTRQRVKPKATSFKSDQLPPSGPSPESNKASPESKATAIREQNEALELEILQEASKMMNEVQIAVTSLDSHGRVTPAIPCRASNTTNGQAIHLWPTQRIYTICSTSRASDVPVNEGVTDDPKLSSGILPPLGIPIQSPVRSARARITSFAGANTPPRSSSLTNLSAEIKEPRISFQPSSAPALTLKTKHRAPPPLPIETSGLSVPFRIQTDTALSPTATLMTIKDGPTDSNATVSKSLAQKAAETGHKLWETSMMVLRRKVNSPCNATKFDTAITPTSDARTSMEIPSVIVSTPLSLPSYESSRDADDPRASAAAMKTPRSQHLHTRSQDFSTESKTRLQERIPFHHHQLAISLPGRGSPSFLSSVPSMESTQGTRCKPKGKKAVALPTTSRGFPEDDPAFMIPDDYLSMIPPSNAIPWSSPTPLPAINSFEGNSPKSQVPSPSTPLALAEATLEASSLSFDRSTTFNRALRRKKSIHEKLFGSKRDKIPVSLSPSSSTTALVDPNRGHVKSTVYDHSGANLHVAHDAHICDPQEPRPQSTKCQVHNNSLVSLVPSSSLLTASNLSTLHPNSNRSSRVIEDYNGRPILWSTAVSVVSSASTTSSSLVTKATCSSLTRAKCLRHPHHGKTTTSAHNPGCQRHGGIPTQSGTGLGITTPLLGADQALRWDDSTIDRFPKAESIPTVGGWTRPEGTTTAEELRADSDHVDEEKRRKEEEYVARVMGQWQSWAETCGPLNLPTPRSKAKDTSIAVPTAPTPVNTRLASRATRVLPSVSSSLTRGNGANITQRVKLGVR